MGLGTHVMCLTRWARTLMTAKGQNLVDLLKHWEERGQGEGGVDDGPGA